MKKNVKPIVALGIIIALFIIFYIIYINGPEISTVGNSELIVKPNLISIYVTSQARNISSSLAQEKVIEISDKFVLELKSLGISEEDIELSNYNVYEEFDWNSGRKSLGFIASQSITIKLEDFNKTSQVIKSATNAGALVSGINYELSNAKQNEYKAEAMKKAGQDAKIKASSLASGFDKRLGRLVAVQSQDYNYYPYPLYAKTDVVSDNVGAERAIAKISPTDLTISASVSATYTMTLF